jgi:hypothetical protein
MSNEITFTTIRNQLHDLDTQFKGSYTTPEALLALVKTIKSFNITITDWNTLINFINTTGSSVEGVYNFIPSIVDLVESEVNKLNISKLEVASKVKRVDALPEVGEPDTYYVVQDEDSETLHRVYFYNKWREEYVYLGSNAIDLGEYYTKTEGQQFEADLNAAFDNFYENAQEIIREKAEIYFASKEDKANKVTTLSNASTDTQYPSAKLVYDTIQYVIAVAEGKCKSYILSYVTTGLDRTAPASLYYKPDGTPFTSWEEIDEYIGSTALAGGCGNPSFNSQENSLHIYGKYLLTTNWTILVPSKNNVLKVGDIILVTETDVPDRWVGSPTDVFYKLETSKVDLTNYVTTNTEQTITGQKTFSNDIEISSYSKSLKWNAGSALLKIYGGNGYYIGFVYNNNDMYSMSNTNFIGTDGNKNLGSSSTKWKNLYLSETIYFSETSKIACSTSGQILFYSGSATNPTLQITDSRIYLRRDLRAYNDGSQNIGSATEAFGTGYFKNGISDGTASFTVGSAYGTMFNYVNLAIGNASQLDYDELITATYDSDTTISLATAPTGCSPEYKGILSSGSSSVTLTFTGVSNILCNDDNCVVVNGTNSTITLPANTTIEVSILNGKMVAINWEV